MGKKKEIPTDPAAPAVKGILEGLNPDQVKAVTTPEGPLLIVAGAGTGKTTVITRRIAYLITAKLARPSEILALTFTDKAASEMEERVDLLVPYGYAEVWISTFHAFGDRILREQALALGLDPDFTVLTRPEQVVFFRERLFEFPLSYYLPLGDPTKYIEGILTLISRAKDEDVSPAEYLQYAEGLAGRARAHPDDDVLQEEARRQMEIALTYKKYQELIAREGGVDFGDQVALTIRLFQEHPAILAEYRRRFRYILVDEFQDTNYAQWQLLQLLAGPEGNLTVVGDDDQSIYKFRGAAVSNLLSFTEAYPRAEVVVLTHNYRSTQAILDAAYRLIRHNDPERLEVRQGLDKRLHALREGGRTVEHRHYDTLGSEADGVTALIEAKVSPGKYRHRDMAILVRANRDADPFLRALNMKGVPWRFSGTHGLYNREEIRLLMAFLRVVADPGESQSLYHLAASELYQIPPLDLAWCGAAARRMNRSLFWAFTNLEAAGLHDLSGEGVATIQKLLADLQEYIRRAQGLSTGEVLYHFLMESGYLKRLTAAQDMASQIQVQNIARFFERVKRFSEIALLDRVAQFVHYQEKLLEAGEDPAVAEADVDMDAVNVLTVHKAKGLEFPVVFLVGLTADKFPSRGRRDPIELPGPLVKDRVPEGDVRLQEERRLFYVAMTRAQAELYLTSSRDYGMGRPKKVSPFVMEALDLPIPEEAAFRASPGEVIERFAPPAEGGSVLLQSMSPDEVLTLSHFSVDDYRTCPLKYKYIQVLRVPIREHHTVVYGKALHDAVQEYFRRKMRGRRMTVGELWAVFEGSWVSRGFLSQEHEEKRLQAGRETLRRFYEREEQAGTIPAQVEKEFGFALDRDRVIGRWDRVDVRGDEAVVIDYKSSDVRQAREANRRARESLQLNIYALAYQQMYGQIPARVELHFLESGLTGVAKKTEKDIGETVEIIKEVAAGIRARDFSAKPNYMACSYCAFREVCPSAWGTEGG
ncbi:MAG: ATP-dependent helicase [Candidatus Methylomirabilales bacterium]